MGNVILSKLENIQIVSLSVTYGRHEVYPYTNRFTGEDSPAVLPALEPFGCPFTRFARGNRMILDANKVGEIEENLERYLQQAFYNQALFEDESTLVLAVASGPLIEFNPSAQDDFNVFYNRAPGDSANEAIYARPSQFYEIQKVLLELE